MDLVHLVRFTERASVDVLVRILVQAPSLSIDQRHSKSRFPKATFVRAPTMALKRVKKLTVTFLVDNSIEWCVMHPLMLSIID